MTKAIKIPHPNGWSTIEYAKKHIQKCLSALKTLGYLPKDMVADFWLVEAHLNNRGHHRHRSLAADIFNAYTSIEDGSCESVELTLKKLLMLLKEANQWRKRKLALKEAGIAKAQ